MELAERLGRTVGELLDGGPGHKAMSSEELTYWIALETLRAKEREQAAKRARSKRR